MLELKKTPNIPLGSTKRRPTSHQFCDWMIEDLAQGLPEALKLDPGEATGVTARRMLRGRGFHRA